MILTTYSYFYNINQKDISKISVDFNFTLTNYEWLCVFQCAIDYCVELIFFQSRCNRTESNIRWQVKETKLSISYSTENKIMHMQSPRFSFSESSLNETGQWCWLFHSTGASQWHFILWILKFGWSKHCE